MKFNIKAIFLSSTLVLPLTLSSHSAFSLDIKEKIKDEISKVNINTKLSLIDEKFLGVEYGFSIKPSYVKGYFSREDFLNISPKLNASDLTSSIFGLNLSANSRVTVVRQFKNQWTAVKDQPELLLFNKLPATAQKAIDNMNPGDFVSFRMNLNLVISKGLAASQGIVSGSLSGNYLLSGEFNLRAYRLKDNQLRLQIFGLRNRNKSLSASLNVDSGFNIFGISEIDKRIKKKVNFNLFSVSMHDQDKDLFMVDYSLNLNDSDVRKAYDSVISSSTKIKNLNGLSLLNPLTTNQKLQNRLVKNIVALEDLANSDNKNVVKNFRAKNELDASGSHFNFGLNLVRYSNGAERGQNNFSLEDNGEKSHYYMSTQTQNNQLKFLFGYFQENDFSQTNTLYSQDEQHKNKSFISYGYRQELRDKTLKKRELKAHYSRIKAILPSNIYSQIEWGDWSPEKQPHKINKVRLETIVRIGRKSLPYFMSLNLSQEQLEQDLLKYTRSKVVREGKLISHRGFSTTYGKDVCKTKELADLEFEYSHSDSGNNIRNRESYYAREICLVAAGLANSFNQHITSDQRAYFFESLKSIPLFHEISMGYLLNLLDPDVAKKAVSLQLFWAGDKMTSLVFSGGELEDSTIDSVLAMESILNNTTYDIRIISEIINSLD